MSSKPPSRAHEARASVCDPSAPHRLSVRVYYEDTDFSGVVYHASYLRFLERGRTEFLRERGIHHRAIFAEGGQNSVSFAVRNMSLDFAKPALMDDLLWVETRVASLGGASIDMEQLLLRDADLLVKAKVRIAVVAGGRAIRIPPALLAKLEGPAP
ncbi:tol-pal system-associated acyl-CoA thioesterase [Methylocapsa acidiphila]|uniref:tol-pal system-associated acyl-CoA thioesterase n=1 Tax=Methylocapsa acidiphila TaxID=133552 RepID=UPI0004103D23|nr:tol-pal system-associated acyl-CoA thioesterase [Methylocapsa acidiphila]